MGKRIVWVAIGAAAAVALLLLPRFLAPPEPVKPGTAPHAPTAERLSASTRTEGAAEPAGHPKAAVPSAGHRTEAAKPRTSPPPARIPEGLGMGLFREAVEALKTSAGVRTIVGLDAAGKDYGGRVKAMKGLTRQIPADDVRALRLFLELRPSDQPELEPIELNGVKNSVLGILMEQDVPPEGLGLQIVGMCRDLGNDEMWRDYCVQYMGVYYEAMGLSDESKAEDPERKAIEEAYAVVLAERDKPIAGTALLGLERLSRANKGLDRGRIEKAATEMASDDRCPQGARITALRICGMMGATNALFPVRILAQTGETVPVQMAAIATLGEIGEAGDAELLDSLAASSDKRTAAVAGAAHRSLAKRVGASELAAPPAGAGE